MEVESGMEGKYSLYILCGWAYSNRAVGYIYTCMMALVMIIT